MIHRLIAAYRGNFFGEIDAHRTPGNAAATTDATRRAELVDPRSQFVRKPLPVRANESGFAPRRRSCS